MPEILAIASLYRTIQSVAEVAATIGHGYDYVRRRLKLAGVEVPRQGGRRLKHRRTAPPDEDIISRYTQRFHTLDRIADDLRVSSSYVRSRLDTAGIPRRPRGWRPPQEDQPRAKDQARLWPRVARRQNDRMNGGTAVDSESSAVVVGIGALNVDCVVPDRAAGRVSPLLAGMNAVIGSPTAPGTERRVSASVIRTAIEIADPLRRHARPGGSAYNALVALAACRLGLRLGYVGVAGASPARVNHTRQLAGLGVDHRFVMERRELAGICLAITTGGDRTLITHEGANIYMSDHIDEHRAAIVDYLAGAAVVHVTSFLDEKAAERLLGVLRAARRRNRRLRICVDPGHVWSTSTQRAVVGILRLADYLILTGVEMRALGRSQDRGGAVVDRLLHRMPAGAVVIVKSPSGATVYRLRDDRLTRTAHRHIPLQPEDVADSVGAGDILAAGVLAAAARGPERVNEGVRMGMALARHAIQHPGRSGFSHFPAMAEHAIAEWAAQHRPDRTHSDAG
ncbi:carbohydrate kinase family protein [Plantactinospora sp. WMMB334]|uniref:carbohydrate kinase family protein n=1 Tax=Plantactinospora sp. WMMB334 TaxID=3404119 RepID=UPI003B928EA2